MLRYKTDRRWSSHLVRHPAKKQSGSILTTREPARCSILKIWGPKCEAQMANSEGGVQWQNVAMMWVASATFSVILLMDRLTHTQII